jgi:hypothetical protein
MFLSPFLGNVQNYARSVVFVTVFVPGGVLRSPLPRAGGFNMIQLELVVWNPNTSVMLRIND